MTNFEETIKNLENSEDLSFRDSANLAEIITSASLSYRDNRKYHQNSQNDLTPENAYALVRKFMQKAQALHGPENYYKQAISSDLARACANIPVETPEMAAQLMRTTSELFEMRTEGQNPQFQLETFAKQGRFLGNRNNAQAYLDVTQKAFAKLDTPYDSCIPALEKYKGIVADHPEMANGVLNTVKGLQAKFPDNPYYKDCINNILHSIEANPNVNSETRKAARESFQEQTQTTQHQVTQDQHKTSVVDKARDFAKKAKTIGGGKNLFSEFKSRMETVIRDNPKLFILGGAGAVFAGIGTANPQLAAAGAFIMAAGIKSISDKMKEMRGTQKAAPQAPKQVQAHMQVRDINMMKIRNSLGRQ